MTTHRQRKKFYGLSINIALMFFLSLHLNAFAYNLSASIFTGSLGGEPDRTMFVYSVQCRSKNQCSMTMRFFEDDGSSSGDVSAPLKHSDRRLQQVQALLNDVRKNHYPISLDHEYKALEGWDATDCWDAGDPGWASHLCRFGSATGNEKWIVLWGDMCSASCYSGFVPLYVIKK